VCEPGLAAVDEVETNMGGTVAGAILTGTIGGQLDGAPGHVGFRKLSVPGQKLDGMPVTIARGKIHQAVNIGRIGQQRRLHQAQAFHELFPVHGAQKTQAGDTVADGNLVGGLVLTVQLDELFDGQTLLAQPLLEPAAREMQHRTLP